jgi:hypothetical protein
MRPPPPAGGGGGDGRRRPYTARGLTPHGYRRCTPHEGADAHRVCPPRPQTKERRPGARPPARPSRPLRTHSRLPRRGRGRRSLPLWWRPSRLPRRAQGLPSRVTGACSAALTGLLSATRTDPAPLRSRGLRRTCCGPAAPSTTLYPGHAACRSLPLWWRPPRRCIQDTGPAAQRPCTTPGHREPRRVAHGQERTDAARQRKERRAVHPLHHSTTRRTPPHAAALFAVHDTPPLSS